MSVNRALSPLFLFLQSASKIVTPPFTGGRSEHNNLLPGGGRKLFFFFRFPPFPIPSFIGASVLFVSVFVAVAL